MRIAIFMGRAVLALLLPMALFICPVSAQDYPERAVKIVVPFAAGGTADAVPAVCRRMAVAQMGTAGGH
jgi:tripartite-type tricarboxylate transporter receptor subunit TctC